MQTLTGLYTQNKIQLIVTWYYWSDYVTMMSKIRDKTQTFFYFMYALMVISGATKKKVY